MTFIHDDPEFDALLRIAAANRHLSLGLVEKDYWVTHALWALHQLGLEVWFKGGTSLSKGFALIERFSEDIDLVVERGDAITLPMVTSWKSENPGRVAERRAYFEALEAHIAVPGADVELDGEPTDDRWRGANIRVRYPGRHLGNLGGVLAPFVRLEVGSARVTPFVPRSLTSFVHDELAAQGVLGDFDDNRPTAVRCVHPLVTLLEKLEGLHRRFEKGDPATFVRHFEDAARIIAAEGNLPALAGHADVRALLDDMRSRKQIVAVPSVTSSAFSPTASARWQEVRRAYEAIAPMFWGPRIALDDCCAAIRDWVGGRLG